MMKINSTIQIPEEEIHEHYFRAGGPGGQNVNKVSTAVQLRFNIISTGVLSLDTKKRIQKIAGNRINSKGELVVESKSYRTQIRNRTEARERLAEIIRAGLTKPHKRIRTNTPSRAKQQRLESKKKRAKIKSNRRKILPGNFD